MVDDLPVGVLYDDIGGGYTATRRQDPRIAEALWSALGDAQSVLNVGAGAGARARGSPHAGGRADGGDDPATSRRRRPAVQASAQELPLPDCSFDAAMAVLSDHHWHDRVRALRELHRVARGRVVLFSADPAWLERFWLNRDYLPEVLDLIPARYREAGVGEEELGREPGRVRLQPVPVPHDCRDGFYGAYWRRPEAYLDPRVRAGISVSSRLSQPQRRDGLTRLRHDLESGNWHTRQFELMALDELDLGYRIVVAELGYGTSLARGVSRTRDR